jgi:hypothetical protein
MGHVSRRLTALMVFGGALVAVFSVYAEKFILGFTGLSFDVAKSGALGALLSTFLLAAPLEEGLKVLVVWPLYRKRRINGPRLGVCYASAAGAGFASVEGLSQLLSFGANGVTLTRVLVSMPAHIFFAGLWGYALNSGRHAKGRFFSLAWLIATLVHGLYDHILWGRGAGLIVTVLPLMVFMALGGWIVLRDVAPTPLTSHHILPDPPSLSRMTDALKPTDQPLMLRWIVAGSFVTLGLIIALLAGAVFLGHRVGIDFAVADEGDFRSAGPLLLLGTAVLAAFPLAGYLVARASSAHSVLEPALAAGLALGAIVAMLSVTAPIGVIFALAVAPLAFGLACGGAWIGLER